MSSIFGPGGGGTTLFEAVVAPSGGDYTTLKDALDAGATTVFVRNGTYNETGNITNSADDVYIQGESTEAVVNMGANTATFSGTRFKMFNIAIDSAAGTWNINGTQSGLLSCEIRKSTNVAARTITMGGNDAYIDNCIINDDNTSSATRHIYFSSTYGRFNNNIVRYDGGGTTQANSYLYMQAQYSVVDGNNWFGGSNTPSGQITIYIPSDNCIVSNNVVDGAFREEFIYVEGNNCTISDNTIFQVREGIIVTNNENSVVGNNIEAASINGISLLSADYNTVVGNSHEYTSGKSIVLSTGSNYNTVIGNHCSRDLEVAGASDNNIVAYNITEGNVTITSTAYNNIWANHGNDNLTQNQVIVRAQNNSGGAVAEGDVVVYDANAAGYYFTTTTTQGDDKVLGMATGTINNGSIGNILTEGKTVALKVNGTSAIAIGDYLGTYTSAGISMKAAAGDMAYAIALEQYNIADSNGIIDALLVKPRKI